MPYRVIRPSSIPVTLRKNAELLFEGYRLPPDPVTPSSRDTIVKTMQSSRRTPFGMLLADLSRELSLSQESVRKTALAALLDFEVEIDLLEPVMLHRPLPLGSPSKAVSLLKSVFLSPS